MLTHQLFSVQGISPKPGLPRILSFLTGSHAASMAWDGRAYPALNVFDAICRGQSHEGGLYP